MRVLMTADAAGGVWTYATELARALATRGVDVTLAVMGPPPPAVPHLDVRYGPFLLEWMDDPWDDVERAGDWLLALEQETCPDLVHLNGYAHAALPWAVPVLVVAHSCVLSWWRAVKGEEAPPRYARYRQEVRRGLQAARLVIAPTTAMMDALEAEYGPLANTRTIPNGCSRRPGRRVAKEQFVFSAARLWDEAKNVMMLDRVAADLRWPVFVAGDARHPGGGEYAPSALRALGVLPREAVDDWLARASIYALPARYEPFGLSALEAALARCALVLGDIPSLREVWGGAAVYVPPDDSAAWRGALSSLIDNPADRRKWAAKAYRRAQIYTPANMAESYLSAYHLLLQTAGRYDLEEHSLVAEADI